LEGVFIVKFNIENAIQSECRVGGWEEGGRGRGTVFVNVYFFQEAQSPLKISYLYPTGQVITDPALNTDK